MNIFVYFITEVKIEYFCPCKANLESPQIKKCRVEVPLIPLYYVTYNIFRMHPLFLDKLMKPHVIKAFITGFAVDS